MAQATARPASIASRRKQTGKPFLGMLDAVSEDAGDPTISPIQRCAAMLEHLWQLVLHDRAKEAAELRRKLEAQLAALQVAQRKYFRADLARLPTLRTDVRTHSLRSAHR